MDLNDMFGRLGLEDGGAQNLFYKSNPDLPEPVVDIPGPLLEDIIWRSLRSEPIRRFFVLRCVCKHYKKFLTAPKSPKSLQAHPVPESWMLKPICVRSSDNTVYLETYDALQKKVQLIPVPANIASCQGQAGLICMDELRVSSSQGGENGLVFLEKFGFSNSNLRECFVFNPMTKSWRQLRLHGSVQQVDRFGSRYLSWASNGGEGGMFPLLLDPVTDIWNRIGSGFTTRGPIRKEKAVVNEVVYQRYQGCRRDLKDQLIIYDMRDQTFREEATTGLPDTMVNEHLFQHEGHIYLATVELFQPTAWKLLLYELKSTNLELNWEKVSEIPAPLLQEVTIPYPALTQMKFFHMDHELLVARFVSQRRSDGVHVLVHGAPCHAIVTYDLTSQSWRKDSESRLGPRLHVSTTVFRPRLDIEA